MINSESTIDWPAPDNVAAPLPRLPDALPTIAQEPHGDVGPIHGHESRSMQLRYDLTSATII